MIFEISVMAAKTDPIVSKMRDLDHTIILRNTQTGWKIVSDQYDDYLWRILRATNLSKAELLQSIDGTLDRSSTIVEAQNLTFSCNLPVDASIHPYDRNGAVAYARQYALTPNTEYYYFPDSDCTNFINQAIHHGSNAEEVGSGTLGWYYNYYNSYLDNDYSASWTDVNFLYDFITDYSVWAKGPEGCDTDQNNALPGDLVQFELQGNTVWDHTVIIVVRGIGGSGYQYWVSGHSDEIDAYPLDSIVYQSRRFVRIERIDGYANLHIPLILNQYTGSLKSTSPNPYPGPMETGGLMQSQATPNPYPAP